MRSTLISTTHKNNLDSPVKNNETGGESNWHVWGIGELDAGICCRNVREGTPLED
jgi:hypothetical protein